MTTTKGIGVGRGGERRIGHVRCSVQSEGANEARETRREIRVCTHRTCRKDGALDAVDWIRGMAPPHVTVDTCGCLGRCGSGPNAVILPSSLLLSYLSTPSHVANLLDLQFGASLPQTNLKAFALKNEGREVFGRGEVERAEELFTQAIDLNPSGGLHNLFANRSAARLAQGRWREALRDGERAEREKPDWGQAYLRQGEALAVGGSFREALEKYKIAAKVDKDLPRSKNYQRKVRELQSKLEPISPKS